jgi:hypothetical protein
MNSCMKIFRRYPFVVFEITLLFLLSLTPILWVHNGFVILGHDSGFRFQIMEHMKRFVATWNSSLNMGTDWSLYKGFLIIQAPEVFFQTLFGSLESAQPFILIFWFFVMAMGMYFAMLGFFPQKKHWYIRLYTSFFWMYNFYILQAWFIAERAKFSLYAALPLALYLIVSTFQRKRPVMVSAIVFGFLYFVLNGGSSPPLFGASMVAWGLTFAVYSFFEIKKNKGKGLLFSLSIIFSFLFTFFVFNAYWIFLQIGLFRGVYSSAVSGEGGVEGLIAWEKEISKYASLVNLIRLQGFPDWYGNTVHPYAIPYIRNPFLLVASFIPFVTIVIGTIWLFLSKKLKLFTPFFILIVILFLFGLFFSSGSHAPTGSLYLLFMRKIPGFAIFRSSFYKFAPILWFSIILGSGYVSFLFTERLKGKSKIIIRLAILICILLYHAPYFSTTFFRFNSFFTTRVKIPEYVKNTAEFLDTEADKGRVLIMPRLDSGFINKPIDTYTWGFYSLDILPRNVSNRSFVANDSNYEIVERLYDSIEIEDANKVQNLANALGISRILFRKDIKQSQGELLKSPVDRTEQQVKHLFGEPIYSSQMWDVYKVGQMQPVLSITSDFLTALEPAIHESELLAGTMSAVIRTNTIPKGAHSGVAVEAECYYCRQDEYNQYISSIIMPSKRNKLSVAIQRFQSLVKKNDPIPADTASRIDYFLSESQNALVNGASNRMDTYSSSIDEIARLWQSLSDRDKTLYANRLYAFLQKQKEYIIQSGLTVPKNATELLGELKNSTWVSDDVTFRMGLTIPVDTSYRLVTVPSNLLVTLNGKDISVNSSLILLKSGYYRISIPKLNSKTIPILFAKTLGSNSSDNMQTIAVPLYTTDFSFTVKLSDAPTLFVYPYTYDSRWKATIKGAKTVLPHVLANGYANGWILPNSGSVTVSVTYGPSKEFENGLLVSSVFILCGIGILFINRKNI